MAMSGPMNMTLGDLDKAPVPTVFEIKDHSASSSWEKFTSQIRNVIHTWKINSHIPNRPNGSIIKEAHLSTKHHSYILHFSDFTFATRCKSDFNAIAHPICTQYGVRAFVSLTRNDDLKVSKTQAQMMLSTLLVAIADEKRRIPVFVQIGSRNDHRYNGAYVRRMDTTYFRGLNLKNTPEQCLKVRTLVRMFETLQSHYEGPSHSNYSDDNFKASKPVTMISTRRRYLKQLKGTYPPGCTSNLSPLAAFPPHLLLNHNTIRGGDLLLGIAAEWSPRAAIDVVENEEREHGLDPTTADRYSIWAIPPKESPYLELTNTIESFMHWNINYHTASILHNDVNLGVQRKSSDNLIDAPLLTRLTDDLSSEALDKVGEKGFAKLTATHQANTYGVSHISSAIASAGTVVSAGVGVMGKGLNISSGSLPGNGRLVLTHDAVIMIVSRCFNLEAECEKAENADEGPKRSNKNIDKKWSYANPYQSLLAALGLYMCVIDRHYNGLCDVALLWNEVVQTCRWHWDNLITIPNVSSTGPRTCDATEMEKADEDPVKAMNSIKAQPPNLNDPLLVQKLQMLNCCIQGKRAREKAIIELKNKLHLKRIRDRERDGPGQHLMGRSPVGHHVRPEEDRSELFCIESSTPIKKGSNLHTHTHTGTNTQTVNDRLQPDTKLGEDHIFESDSMDTFDDDFQSLSLRRIRTRSCVNGQDRAGRIESAASSTCSENSNYEQFFDTIEGGYDVLDFSNDQIAKTYTHTENVKCLNLGNSKQTRETMTDGSESEGLTERDENWDSASEFGSGSWHGSKNEVSALYRSGSSGNDAEEEPQGVSYEHPTMRLLSNGKPMNIPKIQDHVPLTIDMIEKQTLAMVTMGSSELATKQRSLEQSESLLSDMKSFKAANPQCELADFVRWHSPRDWIANEGSEGEGQDCKGCLSERMTVKGSIWREAWETAAAIPAVLQRPLFNHAKEAEKVMQFLEEVNPSQLLSAILLPCLENAIGLFDRCKLDGTQPFDDALMQLKMNVAQLSGNGTSWDYVALSSTLHSMAQTERLAMDCSTLDRAVAGRKQLVNNLAQGRQPELKSEQQDVIGSIFHSTTISNPPNDKSGEYGDKCDTMQMFNVQNISPETNEYILQQNCEVNDCQSCPVQSTSSTSGVDRHNRSVTMDEELDTTFSRDRMYVSMEKKVFRMCTATAENHFEIT
eukprot:CFRG4225T1